MNEELELIQRSLRGDKSAFGELVGRHQSAVCAVTYSGCGNFARSEDLAQDTFVAAWTGLAKLKDPAKFRFWVCGIARNLVRNAHKSAPRDLTSRSKPLSTANDVATSEPSPDSMAAARDEGTLVWQALEELPDNYREPLVLYYREEQSTERVAAALDLSVDTVKQRLSRGRSLLRRQMTAVVEGALTRSRPGPAFTLAVLSALPILLPATGTAAVAATASKSAAVQSAITAGSIGALVGPLIGILGGWFGFRASMKAAKSAAERRTIVRMTLLLGVMIIVFGGGIAGIVWLGINRWSEAPARLVTALVTLVILYGGALTTLIIVFNRRLHRQRADAVATPKAATIVDQSTSFEYRSRRGFLGLPWVHVRTGGVEHGRYRRGIAKGWIAIGDIAIGPGISIGAIAIGGIAFGAVPAGIIAIGGLAIGALAVGGLGIGLVSVAGCAVGYWAAGGVAMGWQAAFGGAALAHEFAIGGAAAATEANTDAARAFFESHPVLQNFTLGLGQHRWIWLFSFAPLIAFALIFRGRPRLNGRNAVEPGILVAGWILECPKCGYAKPLEACGGVRIGASSYQKYVLGFCRRCRRFRWIRVRRAETTP